MWRSLTLAAVVVAAAAFGASAWAQPVLVLHMDDAGNPVADSTPNGNDGTAGAGVTFAEEGVHFGALGFGGAAGQYVTVPRDVSNDIDYRSFTVEMWAYQNAGQTGNVSFAGRNDQDGPVYAVNSVSKKLHLRVHYGLTTSADGSLKFGLYGNDTVSPGGSFTQGEWHHLAFVYDYNDALSAPGFGTRYIYVDGDEKAKHTNRIPYKGVGGAPGYGDGTWYFGSVYGGTERLQGMLDEVRVYQEPLSATTVADHYGAKYSSYRPNATMVLHCEDVPPHDPMADATAYGNDATNHGATPGVGGAIWEGLGFDGNDYLTVAPDPSNNIDSRSFTLEMWAYQNPGATGNQGLAGKNNNPATAPSNRLKCYLYDTGKIHFGFWGNDSETAAGAFTQGDWQHLAFVYDYDPLLGHGDRYLYIDGDPEPLTTWENRAPMGTSAAAEQWYFGSSYGPSWYLDGKLDEIRLYQLALSPALIQQHSERTYSDHTPPIPEPATLALLGIGLGALAHRRRRRR